MSLFLASMACLPVIAFLILSAIALKLCHLERMADIARREVDGL